MRLISLLVAAAALASGQTPTGGRNFDLAELQTQPGFVVSVYATVSGSPRHMAFGPGGVLYVAARDAGRIVAVSKEGVATTAVSGLDGPHSLVFRDGDLYVSVDDGVLRFVGAHFPATGDSGQKIVTLPSSGQHNTRSLGFGPDGSLYTTAGSTCNFCKETDPRRAAMLQHTESGSDEHIFASGLRNTVGFAWHPLTGDLWSVDNGGDGLGDDEPPEEINILRDGGDYGWPDCFGQRRGVDWGPEALPGRCSATTPPEFEMQAHSAPLGIAFYTGDQFPAAFLNDALIAFHGSWNRNDPTGYKVVRVRAASGHAAGIEDFLWGFFDAATRTASGRPVQAITGPDGAVYVSDDLTGNIYRVAYIGPRISPGGVVNRGGGIFELYGARFSGANLSGAAAHVNGVQAKLLASDNQIDFTLPAGVAGDLTIQVVNDKATDQIVVPAE